MTVVSRSWSRLTLPGKVIFTVVPLLVVLTVVAVAAIVLLGPTVVDILAANLPIVRFVVAATVILLITVPTAFLIIYMELKVIALMNLRIGPDRVGPFGSLQSVVPGLKVLMKEDFTPTGADSVVFTWAHRGTADRRVARCACSLTHLGVRSLACSRAPCARLVRRRAR